MVNSKRVLSVIAAIAVLFLIASVAFADVDVTPKAIYDLSSGKIVVSGAVNDSYATTVRIAIYKPGYTADMVSEGTATAADAVANMDESYISGGSYTYEFKLADGAEEGVYTVYVNIGDGITKQCSVYYGKKDDLYDVLQGAANAADEEKLNVFNENSKYLMGYFDAFNKLPQEGKDAVAVETLSDPSYQDVSEFAANLEKNSALWLFRNTRDASLLKDVVEKNSGELGINLNGKTYKTYVEPDASKKSALYDTIISQDYRKSDEPSVAFDKAVATVALNNVESSGQIKSIVEQNAGVFGIDMAAYNKLSYPSSVVSELYKNNDHKAKTCEEFKQAWDKAVANQAANEKDGNTSGSGGGGGGGVSSGVVSTGNVSGAQTGSGVSNAVTVDPEKDNVPEPQLFNDLAGSEWAEPAINFLATAGIVSGKAPYVFAPNDNITREEFLKMLFLGANLKINENAGCNFKDTTAGDWHYRYITTANEMGLVNGIAEDEFGVELNITREDIAVMVVRTLSKLGVDLVMPYDKASFTDDASISDYAVESVYAMQKAGLIKGYEDSSFRPQSNATRAEAAQIIYNLSNLFLN
jgi:hypothetical protein